MGTFNVINSTLNTQYEYKDANLIVTGNYTKNSQDNTLQSIGGSCYRNNNGQQGDYVGNFNGYVRDGVIRYSLSEMTRTDSNYVWDAIGEIETYVLGENDE